ncbi:hypothetical protein IWX49DRAFT_388542 [Phyllosticta citricarpa]|uniref:Uncharacterized protein n=2 Tax=Phyllosticta TaxID=121621 RepID=A0ABR1L375_9PEZI
MHLDIAQRVHLLKSTRRTTTTSSLFPYHPPSSSSTVNSKPKAEMVLVSLCNKDLPFASIHCYRTQRERVDAMEVKISLRPGPTSSVC